MNLLLPFLRIVELFLDNIFLATFSQKLSARYIIMHITGTVVGEQTIESRGENELKTEPEANS